MRYFVFIFSFFLLSSCQDAPSFSLNEVQAIEKRCPLYEEGSIVPVAKITFEDSSLTLDEEARKVIQNVALIYKRCQMPLELVGKQKSNEPKDYGLLRAGLVSKELEKAMVPQKDLDFSTSKEEATSVSIKFNFKTK